MPGPSTRPASEVSFGFLALLPVVGVLPLVFEEGTSWQSLGLKGDEKVTIRGLQSDLRPRQKVSAEIEMADGSTKNVSLICRIDTLDELEYFKNGGILQYVLRQLAA